MNTVTSSNGTPIVFEMTLCRGTKPASRRRARRLLGLVMAPALALVATGLLAPVAGAVDPVSITVQGESPTTANIGTASNAQADGGAYLSLDTADAPGHRNYYATYSVTATADGPHRLEALSSNPLAGGSYYNLSVNGAPFEQVAKSYPYWVGYEQACCEDGSLAVFRVQIGDVELHSGVNTITFMIDEPSVFGNRYIFALDRFVLTPTALALKDGYLKQPINTGTYADGEPATLYFRLNAHAPTAQTVHYRITDYFSNEVAAGSATVPVGSDRAGLVLPQLPTGYFGWSASLSTSPDVTIAGSFVHLPKQRAVNGSANRFAVDTAASQLIPSSRLEVEAEALRDVGVRYVRDRVDWPSSNAAPGTYDTGRYEKVDQTLHAAGLKVLQMWEQTPDWAQGPNPSSCDSCALPYDLRDAYGWAIHTAGMGVDALEVWNEPDIKQDTTTADQLAAYVKAAAVGIHDAPHEPLTSLPSFVWAGKFQDLFLENAVIPYADIWNFHAYASPLGGVPGGETPVPANMQIQNRLHDRLGGNTQLWTTESGNFALVAAPDADLTPSQQVDQARILVMQAAQDFAWGTDKHFWFIDGPLTLDTRGDRAFGLHSRDWQPYPAFGAEAAMTSMLGTADFQATLALPDPAKGFVFSNGGHETICVVWAAVPTAVDVPASTGSVEVYDIMGVHKGTVPVSNGVAPVTATLDPIYVVSKTQVSPPRPSADDTSAPSGHDLSDAQHIVLSQRVAPANAAPTKDFRPQAILNVLHPDQDLRDPTPIGYQFDPSTTMSLDVYNFNTTAKTVTVTASVNGGWSLQVPTQAVTVPAMGRATLSFTIAAGVTVVPGVDSTLRFDATMDGATVPVSISRMQLKV